MGFKYFYLWSTISIHGHDHFVLPIAIYITARYIHTAGEIFKRFPFTKDSLFVVILIYFYPSFIGRLYRHNNF